MSALTSVGRLSAGVLLAALLMSGCDALISPQHRIERARAEMQSGEWGSAAVELRKAVQSDPGNREAWLLLTRLSLDAADASDAQDNLNHALKAGATGPELARLQVRTWLATNRPKALLAALTHHTLALAEPGRSIALARAYEELDRPDEALALLDPVLAAHPTLTDAKLAAAEALALEGHLNRALKRIAAVGDADPKQWQASLLRGQILARQGQLAAAQTALEHALSLMRPATPLTQRALALVELTETQLGQGQVDEAARTQQRLSARVPGAPIAELLGARIELARRHYIEGIAQLEKLVEQAPRLTSARTLLGAAQLFRGELEQAQSQLEQVVQQRPNDLRARKLLALVRLRLDQPQGALDALAPALDAPTTHDQQLLALLGAVETRAGSGGGVVATLEHRVHEQPQNRTLRLSLAAAYLRTGRADAALAVLAKTPAGTPDLPREGLLVAALDGSRGAAAATARVNDLLAAQPHDPAVLDLAARYFASQYDFARAQSLLRQSLALRPQDAGTLMDLAGVQAANGHLADSERTLQGALAAHPADLAVRIALAETLTREKAFAQAERVLRSAGPAKAGAPELAFALARVQLARGDLHGAEQHLDAVIASEPGSAELVNRAGLLLLRAGQFPAALARLRKACELAPEVAAYWLDTASAQIALNDPAAARESLEKASRLRPDWLAPVRMLTLLDARAKRFTQAIARAKTFLAGHRSNAQAMALLGDVDFARGRFARAAADYAQVQERSPSALTAVKLFRARVAAHQPNPQQSLKQWLAAQPNDYRTRIVLGDYDLATHSLREAARDFETAAKLAPTNVVALNNLAWTYEQLGDARAKATAEKAYQLAPWAASVNDTLGWILARNHATARALSLLARATQLDPANPDMAYHYAYALVQAGKRSAARKILAKVLANGRPFDSRSEAERLFADLRA